MFKKLFKASVLTVASVNAQEFGNAVDITVGFFKGYGKSNVASDIETTYQIIEGTYDPSSPPPCG